MLFPHLQTTHPAFSLHDEVLALLPPQPGYVLEEDLTRDLFGVRNATTRRKMNTLLSQVKNKYLGVSIVHHKSGETRVSIQRKVWDIIRLIAEDYLDSLDIPPTKE